MRALDDHNAPQQLLPAHQLQLFEWVGGAVEDLTQHHYWHQQQQQQKKKKR